MRSKFVGVGIILMLMLINSPAGVKAEQEDSAGSYRQIWKPETPYLDYVLKQADSVEGVEDTIVYRRNGEIIAVSYRDGRTEEPQVAIELREAYEVDSMRNDGFVLMKEYRPITNREGVIFFARGFWNVFVVDTSAVLGEDSAAAATLNRVRDTATNQKEDVSTKEEPPCRAVYFFSDSEYRGDDLFFRGPMVGVVYMLDDQSYHQSLEELIIGVVDTVGIGLIRGKVVELDTHEPIKGVTVAIVGIDRIAVTDSDGKFFIERVPAGKYELVFSAKGYRTVRDKDVGVYGGAGTYIPFLLERLRAEG